MLGPDIFKARAKINDCNAEHTKKKDIPSASRTSVFHIDRPKPYKTF